MTISFKRKKVLNDKECFDLWWELGTISAVVAHLANAGVINPNTKRAMSYPSVQLAARRYVANFPEEARAKFIENDNPDAKDDELWFDYLAKAGRQAFTTSRSAMVDWIIRMEKIYPGFTDVFMEKFGEQCGLLSVFPRGN